MTNMKMSIIRGRKFTFLRLLAAFLTTCRFGCCNNLLALVFCKRCRIGALWNLIVSACMLDVRTVGSVDDLDVAASILGDYSSCLLVEAVLDELDAGCKVYLQRIGSSRKRNVLVTVLDVWTETALGAYDVDSVMLSDIAGKLEKLERLFKGDAFDKLAWGEARILLVVSVSLLNIWKIGRASCRERV